MACLQITETNQLEVTSTADSECTSYILMDADQYHAAIDTYVIDPLEISLVFGWAFGVVVFFWYMGFKIGIAKRAVNKT